jgi:TonB family protein
VTEIARFTLVILLLLASCRSASPRRSIPAADRKKLPNAGQIRIVEILGSPKMIRGARPMYPKEAKTAHIEGVVKVQFIITKTGEVAELQVLSGDPVLVPAAIEAVKKWRFAPCRVDGSEPVEIKTESLVSFTLHQ